jgi:hypothetical protein
MEASAIYAQAGQRKANKILLPNMLGAQENSVSWSSGVAL